MNGDERTNLETNFLKLEVQSTEYFSFLDSNF